MMDNLDETSSIFDESFNAGLPVRRRKLLSTILRVFVWIGMLLSGLISLLVFINMVNIRDVMDRVPDYSAIYVAGLLLACLIPGAILFLMTFPVWMEARWAINFNVVLAVMWAFLLLTLVLFLGIPSIMLMLPSALYLVPYWILLFSIRKKWNQ
ncbi:hypothetical protein [Chitinophaga pinensis]|uniref:Uncharacterized protein n=1 Tax=Chitinophaga pinensis TaxID=79329 RepID=A0A5C6LVZ9_9BACT|nr:hypothetical protein [Chitinophaga pinensis]TWW00827.1 hypothetical protein FEF09_10055 [Chitinophaga pinensis]